MTRGEGWLRHGLRSQTGWPSCPRLEPTYGPTINGNHKMPDHRLGPSPTATNIGKPDHHTDLVAIPANKLRTAYSARIATAFSCSFSSEGGSTPTAAPDHQKPLGDDLEEMTGRARFRAEPGFLLDEAIGPRTGRSCLRVPTELTRVGRDRFGATQRDSG